ncbi:hypothetical protein A5641_02095 [Mycobacterium sp. 1554424.7]|nr:hypothetical protein A5641_02095 [Mycobacterium sp. 1554424.7]
MKDFADEKNPTTNQEKQLVVVYWLHDVAERAVTTGEVIAAFNFLRWKNPSDPANALAVTSAKKGWLDTGDMNDIKLHWQGENHLQHELPRDASK